MGSVVDVDAPEAQVVTCGGISRSCRASSGRRTHQAAITRACRSPSRVLEGGGHICPPSLTCCSHQRCASSGVAKLYAAVDIPRCIKTAAQLPSVVRHTRQRTSLCTSVYVS